MRSECLYDVHREVARLFVAAGCRTAADRQRLSEELVGPGPVDMQQARALMQRLREAITEPHEEAPCT